MCYQFEITSLLIVFPSPDRFYYSICFFFASFLTAKCLLSVSERDLEKYATSLRAWLKVAAIGKSEASVSTSKVIVSSIVLATAFSISTFKF